ncbi:hypothetical protein M514_06111 [Trichuris suis]|uniref:Uncharacterized protein n=1 Tax=Trichuris suis TaxID=68888 RepID=A0A085NK79_9BILA|nr:hypothetical protein M513_06111 [Trichuris suis]KFD69875.1 hypothetical protein M514_06111 [Trichuris suis]
MGFGSLITLTVRDQKAIGISNSCGEDERLIFSSTNGKSKSPNHRPTMKRYVGFRVISLSVKTEGIMELQQPTTRKPILSNRFRLSYELPTILRKVPLRKT